MSDAKWSPEPWGWRRCTPRDGPGANECVYDAERIMLLGTTPQGDPGDARRIVAAVNACAGIPTEALEAGALGTLLGLVERYVDPTVCGAQADNMGDDPETPCWDCRTVDTLRSLGRLP